MRHNITELDKSLLLQNVIHYKYRVFVTDDEKNIIQVMDTIYNIDSIEIDGDSDVRRTFSFTMSLPENQSVHNFIAMLLPFRFVLQAGIENIRTGEYLWYECGTYMLTDASTSYDAANNNIMVKFCDMFAKLDGTRNGQIGGAPTILLPSKDADGNPVTLKDTLTNFLKEEGISDYIVEDIGEFYGIQANNKDGYLAYRDNNPLWNKLPYDLTFDIGSTVADIITEITSLYPNIQKYFDIYNHFCAEMIPSCEHTPIDLDHDFLSKLLVADNSENVSYDIPSIKNVTEVFGKTYDIDRLSQTCSASGNIYTITLPDYDSYKSNEYVVFTPNITNTSNMRLRINMLADIPIYYEHSTNPILPGEIKAKEAYVGLIKRNSGDTRTYVFYFLGQYQPHALCVLTDNASDNHYTKNYYAEKYNCSHVTLREEKGSPFTVQKIGEVLDIKSGEQYDNIISESVAMENAIYENQKVSSMNDTVEITVKLIPWLDVHCKVAYRKTQESKSSFYLVKKIIHNIADGTSTITMAKFYPLYFK